MINDLSVKEKRVLFAKLAKIAYSNKKDARLSAKLLGFTKTVLFSIAFELLESPLKQANPDLFPHPSPDTTTNMIGDTIAVIVGWNLG